MSGAKQCSSGGIYTPEEKSRRGRTSRGKGGAEERAIVRFFCAIAGWTAKRVPLSGGAEGFPGDVYAYDPAGRKYRIESKRRASGDGFKTLRRWLGDNDFLWLREDRAEGMVVMSAQTFRDLIAGKVE